VIGAGSRRGVGIDCGAGVAGAGTVVEGGFVVVVVVEERSSHANNPSGISTSMAAVRFMMGLLKGGPYDPRSSRSSTTHVGLTPSMAPPHEPHNNSK